MKISLVILSTLFSSVAFAQVDTSIAAQLQKMVDVDQAARKNLKGNNFKDVDSIDHSHNAFLKQIINRYHAYPGKDKIGGKGAYNFWLLVQHQDRDSAFQLQVLPLLKTAADQGQVKYDIYAYLYDRVMLNTGRKQLYGTQCWTIGSKDGSIIPRPMDDSLNVDTRRMQMGLDSLHVYLKQVNEIYK